MFQKQIFIYIYMYMKDQLYYSHLSSHVHWRSSSQIRDSMPELNKFIPHTHTHTHNVYVYSKTFMQKFIAFLTGTNMSQLN